MLRCNRGQTAPELMGMLLVIAAVIGALVSSNAVASVSNGVRDALCTIAGAGCTTSAPTRDDHSTETAAEEMERRQEALEAFAAGGEGYAELLARAKTEQDMKERDRLLDLLEHLQELKDDARGNLVDDLNRHSAAGFDDLVGQGTIEEDGGRNRRYFTVPPSPGDGLVVMDFFIPGENSGPLKGDGRDTQDPLLGDTSLDDSRVVIAIDRETGRGVITQSQTCFSSWVPGSYCESPRPIELRDPRRNLQINPIPGAQAANEFRVDGGPGSLEIEYDALNSITPVGASVDGTVRFERGPDGDYQVVEDSRDSYPRVVTGQYRPGRPPRVIDETDDQPVVPGALPGPSDVIDGIGDVVKCSVPIPGGPIFGPARDAVC